MIKKFCSQISEKQRKDAGIVAALILLILALVLKSFLFLKLSIVILFIDIVWPGFFYFFAIFWFGLAHILGIVMNKIILSIVFLLFVVPVGMIRIFLGKDSMKLKYFKKGKESVMKTRDHLFSSDNLNTQY